MNERTKKEDEEIGEGRMLFQREKKVCTLLNWLFGSFVWLVVGCFEIINAIECLLFILSSYLSGVVVRMKITACN